MPIRCQDATCRDQVEVYVEQVKRYYCASCAGLLHSNKTHVHIPNPKASYSCIEQGYHILKKVNTMKNAKKLDEVWAKFLPELKEFEYELEDLRKRYYEITERRILLELPSLQNNCFDFITKLYESEALQSYLREHMLLSMKLEKDEIQYSENKKNKNLNKAEVLELVNGTDQHIEGLAPPQKAHNSPKLKKNKSKPNIKEEIKNENDKLIIKEESKREEESSKEIEEMKSEIQNLSQELQNQNENLIPTHESFNELYQKITGKTGVVFDSSSNLTFDLSVRTSQTLLKCLQFYKLPELDNVTISNIHKFNCPKIIGNFMKNAIHHKIKQFDFFFTPNSVDNFSSSFSPNYFESLKKVASTISEDLYINNFTLSQTEYQDLLIAAKKCKTIETHYCYINFEEECDFGSQLDDAQFTYLGLYQVGSKKYGKWKQEGFKQFRNLINGLAKVEYVRETKIDIRLDNCGMTKAEARKMLDSVGLKKMSAKGVS
ncbi:unnamed protein product [Moneuplotes crassus]|uniref:Uncharacterized protein n=1 Tax=Euplotes crassus TaxID=5936 RepID=A0AAD1U724_EUPCR|nr:unnamed protein product [Moneuplotes crassus]